MRFANPTTKKLVSSTRWRQTFLRPAIALICGFGCSGLLLSGCGREVKEATEINSNLATSQVTPAIEKPHTTTVTASKIDVATSPAAAADALPPTHAEPAEVCQRFMELLQSGNRIAAENLLTRPALTATSKAGLQLEPMGSRLARYEIGATRFATIKNELAQIDCEVIDQIDGVEVRSSLTWLLRRQNLGWRIAGLMMQLTPEKPKDLLSFENLDDVQKIKNMAAADVNLELATRQADASGGSTGDTNTLK